MTQDQTDPCAPPAAAPLEVRTVRCRAAMGGHGLDAMLFSNPAHVRYLTGYAGTNGHAFLTHDQAFLLTDGRYALAYGQGLPEPWTLEAHDQRTATIVARLLLNECLDVIKLGVEADHVTLTTFREWQRIWTEVNGNLQLVETSGLAAELSRPKDERELELLEAVCELTDAVINDVVRQGVVGLTERQLAGALLSAGIRGGASGPSFPPIVATGANGAEIHHETDGTVISEGLLLIDFGLTKNGYSSDLSRTFAVGAPTDQQANDYMAVHAAQQAAAAAVAPGAAGAVLDQLARQALSDRGVRSDFPHALGHGVGMTLTHSPVLGVGSEDEVMEGEVVTLEPGLYQEDVGGIRIEDCFVVTSRGARVLGHPATAELTVLNSHCVSSSVSDPAESVAL